MRKELQIFTNLQRQDVPVDKVTLEDLESLEVQESVLRPLIREVLKQHAEFHNAKH